jgi:hypothetical protein
MPQELENVVVTGSKPNDAAWALTAELSMWTKVLLLPVLPQRMSCAMIPYHQCGRGWQCNGA